MDGPLTPEDPVGWMAECLNTSIFVVLDGLEQTNSLVRRECSATGRAHLKGDIVCVTREEMCAVLQAVRCAVARFGSSGRKEWKEDIVSACALFVLSLRKFEPTAVDPGMPWKYADVCVHLSASDEASALRRRLFGLA